MSVPFVYPILFRCALLLFVEACVREMLCICVRFGSKVSPRTIGCVAMGSAVLFIWRLADSAGSGVHRLQVVCLDLV